MLSTAGDLVQIAQVAPWAAVGLLALAAAAWVYRQARRLVTLARAEQARSARAQGERLGRLEKDVQLAELRRRQVEWVLLDLGVELPLWPPDGPDQPRPRPRRDNVDEDQADEDQADELEDGLTTEQPYTRIPVPPLPRSIGVRHRR